MSRQGETKTTCQDNVQQMQQKGQIMTTDNIKNYIQDNLRFDDDICERITDYTNCTSEYIDDTFTEIADNNIDLYYSGLLDWLRDCSCATDYIEQAVKGQGIDSNNFDFMRLIQAGQYEYNMEKLNDNRHNVLLLWCLQYCIENDIALTDEQIDNLDDEIDDYANYFDDLVDTINEIKGGNDDE